MVGRPRRVLYYIYCIIEELLGITIQQNEKLSYINAFLSRARGMAAIELRADVQEGRYSKSSRTTVNRALYRAVQRVRLLEKESGVHGGRPSPGDAQLHENCFLFYVIQRFALHTLHSSAAPNCLVRSTQTYNAYSYI